MSDPLWERLLVAAMGPAVAAVLALLVLNRVTSRAQQRREAGDTREALAAELTDTANSLYLALQAFWRSASSIPLKERSSSTEIAKEREHLHATYQSARSRGQVLEQRLKIYYSSEQPGRSWHKVTDLLTVRYFLLLEGAVERRKNIRKINAGELHSGLTEDELNQPKLLLSSYRQALAETIASLWNYDVDRQGRHLAGTSVVSTWHLPPE